MLNLFHQCFDKEGHGSLSAGDLSNLMGALLGVPQHKVEELYAKASNDGCLTEGELWLILVFYFSHYCWVIVCSVHIRTSATSADQPPHLSESSERVPASR